LKLDRWLTGIFRFFDEPDEFFMAMQEAEASNEKVLMNQMASTKNLVPPKIPSVGKNGNSVAMDIT